MRLTARLLTGGAAFKSRSFRWLSAGSSLNSAGMQGEQVILGYLIYRLTESSAWVGLSLALFFAPMLLVGVPAGALADRFDRRSLLMATEAALLAALLIFAWCLHAGFTSVIGVLIMSALSGTLRSIHQPARLSYAGDIAAGNGLVAALSMMSITTRFGQLLGAIVAGLASEIFGPAVAYTVLATGHGLALLAFRRADNNQPPSSSGYSGFSADSSILQRVSSYFAILFSTSTVIILVVLASLVEVFGFSFATALPEIAIDRLAINDSGLGAMHAMRAAGGLLGALALSLFVIRQPGILYLLTISGFGLALLALSFAQQLYWVLLAIGIVAIFASSTDILIQSMLQMCVPANLRGRAMGAWVFALGMGPIGHLELGFLIGIVGTTAALATNGVILILVGITSWLLFPQLRRLGNLMKNSF